MLFVKKMQSGPATDPGDRIYAIGDVHGRFDLLQQLMVRIAEHSASLKLPSSLNIIFLGDLIDRGPDSLKVLEYLFELQRQVKGVVVLQGNHEEIFLKAIDGDLRVFRSWLSYGGAQMLQSLGVAVPGRDDDLEECLAEMRRAISPALVTWIRRLPFSAQSGDYFFCHAGVRPGVQLKRQTREDLLWIRDDFLDDDSSFGAVVVHGHTISPEVEMRHNRIGIDTGAYLHGVLTGLFLEDGKREILQVGRDRHALEENQNLSGI